MPHSAIGGQVSSQEKEAPVSSVLISASPSGADCCISKPSREGEADRGDFQHSSWNQMQSRAGGHVHFPPNHTSTEGHRQGEGLCCSLTSLTSIALLL